LCEIELLFDRSHDLLAKLLWKFIDIVEEELLREVEGAVEKADGDNGKEADLVLGGDELMVELLEDLGGGEGDDGGIGGFEE
jgi:hypothetical protein